MATLKKYNLTGQQIGSTEVSDEFIDFDVSGQMLKDYLVAIRNNARQWSASTKTRKEVAHTTKKCYKQKGTGNARHSDLVAPQYRGGGIAHGPKPKFDVNTRINKKEKRAAIRYLIAHLMHQNSVILIDETSVEAPKTKIISHFLSKVGVKGRVLFLGEGNYSEVDGKSFSVHTPQHENFRLSLRNIPKVEFKLARNISGQDVALAKTIVMTPAALEEIIEWLS